MRTALIIFVAWALAFAGVVGTVVYTMLVENGQRYCWTWNDHDMIRRRLKTKRSTS